MARKPRLEVANFICRFGDKAVLLDMFDEVVRPAFMDQRERKLRYAANFFLDTDVIQLEKSDPESLAIVGRFVKDTVLHREQIFDAKRRGLVTSPQDLPSAPSSIFVLLLASHRLLFVREQSDSPSFAAFQSTSQRFLRQTHLNYLNEQWRALRASGENVSKKSLKEQLPIPDVEVVPVYSPDTLEQFVRRFKILNSVRFTLMSTNTETDNSSWLLDEIRKNKDVVKSQKTTFEHRSKDGLAKEKLIGQLKAARQGNTVIRLDGVDANGNSLNGDNQKFNFRHEMDSIPEEPKAAARQLFAHFKQIRRGEGKTGKNSERAVSSHAQ